MAMVRSRSIFELDLYIAFSAISLLVIGIMFIFSSGVAATGQVVSTEYLRQILWASTGLVIMFLITFTDYRIFERTAVLLYLMMIVLLILTLMFGRIVNGARRWIGIAGFGGQPSEFMKIALLILLARYYSNRLGRARSLVVFLGGLGLTLLPTMLVLLQPDLGSAMVYIPIFLVVAFFSGARPAHIGFLVATGLLFLLFTVIPFWQEHLSHRALPAVGVLTDLRALQFLLAGVGLAGLLAGIGLYATRRPVFGWILYSLAVVVIATPMAFAARRFLRDYQIMRLVVFVDPYIDPQGAGWNIIQSITAIGSGGVAGKGYLQGTQSHFQYLPAQSTDFIFSILAEEWGFLGVLLVFALFVVIFVRSLYVMVSAREHFAAFLVAGVLALFVVHFTINIGMTIGMMPVTGLPLLLLSFGGSSVWTALIGLGLVMSVYQHRYQY